MKGQHFIALRKLFVAKDAGWVVCVYLDLLYSKVENAYTFYIEIVEIIELELGTIVDYVSTL